MEKENLEKQVEELSEENEALRKKIRGLRRQLDSYRNAASRNYYQDQDYVPYPDRDDYE